MNHRKTHSRLQQQLITMSSSSPQLPPNITSEPISATRLTSTTSTPFSEIITRFRTLVPPLPKTPPPPPPPPKTRSTYETAINSAVGAHGFLLFNEYNHGRWINLFPSSNDPNDKGPNDGRGMIRFIFGNNLIAITMIQEDVEAGLCVPIEMLLLETVNGGAKCVAQLPSGLMAGHEAGKSNEKLVAAAQALDGKLLKLIEDLMK